MTLLKVLRLKIVILGTDGSGKSSAIRALEDKMRSCFGVLHSKHWRPSVLQDVGGILKKRSKTEGPTLEPHQQMPHSRAVSLCRLLYYMLDYWLGFLWEYKLLAQNSLLIYDRYAYDMAIDPRRFRFQLPQWLLDFCVKLVPQPDMVFCLDAPVEVLRSRKQEISEEETARQRKAYRIFVESLPNGHVINVNQPLENVVAEIQGILFEFMRRDDG